VVLRDPLPWPELRIIVETVEETGYEAVFVPEISAREAFSTLTGFAPCTTRLRLGTGVVTVWSRDPATTAMGAATIHDLSGGRLILGLGAGTRPPGRQDLSGASIIEVVGDYVRLVRQILSGQPVGPDERFGKDGFELGLDLPTGPPPIWLGALGDRMIELAGRVADGVILNWCTPERVAEAVTLVARGAEEAGRDPDAVTVSVYLRACLGVEDDVALEALKPMAGQYAAIPHYLRQFERMGVGEGAAAAAKAHEAGRPDGVPDDFVRAVAVTGGRKEATARFDAFGEAGADLVLWYPVAALEPFSSVLGTILAAAPSPSVER
jgi:5,10-methylenetetrahydromethanopterin reductase